MAYMTLIATGQNVSGGNDQSWQVETSNLGGSYAAAVVETTNPFLSFYATPTSPAQWIGVDSAGSAYTGNRRYKTSILCNGGLPLANVTGRISSDNQCVSLKVNGSTVLTNLTPSDVTAHENKHSFSIPYSAFALGDNELLFEVNDTGTASGLLVEWDAPPLMSGSLDWFIFLGL